MHNNKKHIKKGKKRQLLSLLITFIAWCGAALIYYIIFSIFFDTPIEYEIRKTNTTLNEQYNKLSQSLDSLEIVVLNISERDENVYKLLFESKPYNSEYMNDSISSINNQYLSNMNNREIIDYYYKRLDSFEEEIKVGSNEFIANEKRMINMGDSIQMIPSIQPIVNTEYTKLAASFGVLIQPFVKNLFFHQGIDYAIPEETRIFATASGTVSSVRHGINGEGLTIDIGHGNGYTTTYSHLNKSLVRRGQKVKWGDIIAYSGNSGLSYLPHLHYSISFKDEKIDPINYFFYELDAYQLKKINALAQVAVQSLD